MGVLDKFSNDLLRKLAAAESFDEPAGVADADYYSGQIANDLRPFNDGITERIQILARAYGIGYKIINGTLYRGAICTFPARCSGAEHFLKKLAPSLRDTEFVLNDFDQPRIPWGGLDVPVLSFSKDPSKHMDILYPAWSFWEGGPAIAEYPQGIGQWDEMRKKVLSFADRVPWKEKHAKAFFRGSRTTEQRDPLVQLSRKEPDLVDAQYTKNQAYRGPEDTLGYPAAEVKPFEYNCHYKYLVNFRGVAASFRYKHLLLCNSVVLHLGDGMIEFFYHRLVPYYHYIPIEENTQESWSKHIKFLREHDDLAERIAKRSQTWIRAKLTNRDVLNYWRKLLEEYTKLLRYEVKLEASFFKV